MEVNDSLVDPHLIPVPGLGALATWSLTSRDLQDLGRHTNGTFDLQLRLPGTSDKIPTHCQKEFGHLCLHHTLGVTFLQTLYIAAGEGDSDLVNLCLLSGSIFLVGLSNKIHCSYL